MTEKQGAAHQEKEQTLEEEWDDNIPYVNPSRMISDIARKIAIHNLFHITDKRFTSQEEVSSELEQRIAALDEKLNKAYTQINLVISKINGIEKDQEEQLGALSIVTANMLSTTREIKDLREIMSHQVDGEKEKEK